MLYLIERRKLKRASGYFNAPLIQTWVSVGTISAINEQKGMRKALKITEDTQENIRLYELSELEDGTKG